MTADDADTILAILLAEDISTADTLPAPADESTGDRADFADEYAREARREREAPHCVDAECDEPASWTAGESDDAYCEGHARDWLMSSSGVA